MTAKILQFKRPERPKAAPKPAPKAKSNQEIFKDVYEDVIGEWQRAAAVNGLSDLILAKLPTFMRKRVKAVNVTDDLNILAYIESGLNMQIAVFCPGTAKANSVGWTATFHRGKEVFSTPPDMASEAVARALNIVLFACFESTLKSLGRS